MHGLGSLCNDASSLTKMLWSRQVKRAVFVFSALFAYFIFRLLKWELATFSLIYSSEGPVPGGRPSPEHGRPHHCPACFGRGLCARFAGGPVLSYGDLPIARHPRVAWREGVLDSRRVVVASPSPQEWSGFDEFVCRNASRGPPCDPSSAVFRTVLATGDFLSPEKFRDLNALLDVPPSHFSLPVCATEKLVVELSKSFDENEDGFISEEEKILLLTSLIMQPGYAILKLQDRTKMSLPIPNLLGACGRSIVIEGGLKSLTSYLSESFDIRAGLAVQVLQLVEDFETA